MARRLVVNCGTGETLSVDSTPEDIAQEQVDATTATQLADAELIVTSNSATLADRTLAALQANRTFVALASPTNAQTLAQVKALTRQVNGLIRLTLGQLDATD